MWHLSSRERGLFLRWNILFKGLHSRYDFPLGIICSEPRELHGLCSAETGLVLSGQLQGAKMEIACDASPHPSFSPGRWLTSTVTLKIVHSNNPLHKTAQTFTHSSLSRAGGRLSLLTSALLMPVILHTLEAMHSIILLMARFS